MKNSLYDRLGLPPDATPEEIRHAYRQLVMHLHPDINMSEGETELFIDIQQAYDNLSDPIKKAEYDRQMSQSQSQDRLVKIKVYYSQPSLVRIQEPQLVYTLVELHLHRNEGATDTSTPLNISLVVDCSTSMQGLRLDTVKLTAIELMRQLHPDDIFSLVKFNDRAELLLPAGARVDMKSAEMKVQLLQAGGGTEIFQGLDLGFAQVNKYLSGDLVNQVILITDGRTYGDESSCEDLANQAASLGIGITALGIGNMWNDVFLDHLASKTGGICKYASEISEIRSSILDELIRLGSRATDQITFNYSIPDNVELRSIFRLSPDSAPLVTESPISLGSIPRSGGVSFLMEFLVKDISENQTDLKLANGFINYRITHQSSKSQHVQRLEFKRQITLAPGNEPPPEVIVNAISMLSLYRMQERARKEMGKGDLKSAARHLELLATHLLKKGKTELADDVLSEVKYIQQNQSFSEDGEKRIKYGTRALLLPAGTEKRVL